MDAIQDNWFTEKSDLWPHQRFSFSIQSILHSEKSKYQDILILQSQSHGRVLVLDGVIQCSETDEFAYQEMMSFLPLNSHRAPKRVLIVGGGDGGVAREVAKHPQVEKIVQVEIDERVVELSRQYLPFMAEGFQSEKLTLHIGDGLKFLENHQNDFDVIITDSSDPVGPALCLFTSEYFSLLNSALRPNGIICSQAGNPFSCTEQVADICEKAKKAFSQVAYACVMVPTYPSGQIGCLLATNDPTVTFEKPAIVFDDNQMEKMKLRYYDANMHNASFQLPRFLKKALKT